MQNATRTSSKAPTTQSANPRLRVALVTESYPPEVNGVATTVARIVNGLRESGHTVQLVRPRQNRDLAEPAPGDRDDILTPGVPIPVYTQLRMGLPATGRLTRAWTDRRPDIVHIATEGPLGWSALHAALALGLPVCSDFRTNFHAYGRFYGLGWLHRPIVSYLRRFHNRCECTMVPTQAMQQQLAAAGFQRLEVVARGVDTGLFSPGKRSDALRQQWGVYDSDLVVLHVGRLAPEKNLRVVLKAFDGIRRVQPRARLVFVGDGPSRSTLQAQCPQAIFAGLRRGHELAAHYASSDMFLFPSLTETYGNVTPEAMASGLPMVAFNDAAAGQLIRHGTNGLLAAKDDVAAFLQRAIDLAAHPQWRARIGNAARARVIDQSWSSVVGTLEQLYAVTIRRAGSPRVWYSAGAGDAALAPHPSQPMRQ